MSAAPVARDTTMDRQPATPEQLAIVAKLMMRFRGGGGIVFEVSDEPAEPQGAEPGGDPLLA